MPPSSAFNKLVSSALPYNPDVQKLILRTLGASFKDRDISSGLASVPYSSLLNVVLDPVDGFVVDGGGRRLGFNAATGPVTEIPASRWFGNEDGTGWIFGPFQEPLTLELTGRGQNYYVQVGAASATRSGGLTDEGFLALGEKKSLPIPIESNDFSAPNLTALSPARVFLGVKNSDDVGTKFDLKAEVFQGATLIGSGQLNGVSGGSSGFNNARLDAIPLSLFAPVGADSGVPLRLALSARITCSGSTHASGAARLWYNDAAANSRFGATIGEFDAVYYLRDGLALASAPGPGPKKTIDVVLDSKSPCPARPFSALGAWSLTLP